MEAPDRSPRIRIPGYVIETEIGRGGVATVYLATQQSLDRKVALKVMSPALAAEPDFTERFEREGRTVARFSHPNIVTIYDVGVADYQHYIAMEYLSGGSLKRHLHRPVDAGFALSIVRQMAQALGYAHDQGYVHRDVKPENILFRADGEAVLTDFGIAKSSDSHTQLTRSGTIVGTPRYMSPEQAQGENATARSDIYALGVILYEMLTARPPFDTPESLAVLYSHINDPIPELPASAGDMQPLVDAMMAKDPEDRVPDCKTLIDIVQMVERERAQPSSTRRKPRMPVRSVEQQRRDRASAAKTRETIDVDAITEEIPVVATRSTMPRPKPRRPVTRLLWLGLTGAVVGTAGWLVVNSGGFTPLMERFGVDKFDLSTLTRPASKEEMASNAPIPKTSPTVEDDSSSSTDGVEFDSVASSRVTNITSASATEQKSADGPTTVAAEAPDATPTDGDAVSFGQPERTVVDDDTYVTSTPENTPGAATLVSEEDAARMVRRDLPSTSGAPVPTPVGHANVGGDDTEAGSDSGDDNRVADARTQSQAREVVTSPAVAAEESSPRRAADGSSDAGDDQSLLPRDVDAPPSGPDPDASASRVELDRMMREARDLTAQDRLSHPPGANAIERFRDVLAAWPGNLDAQQGLRDIAATYYGRAQEKYDSGDHAGASLDIERGLKADPDNGDLRALGQRIRDAVVAADAFADAENYFYGHSVTVDFDRAFERYSEAADKGHADASLALAAMYANGLGISRNDSEAVRLLRTAAADGDPEAQYSLGLGLLFSDQRNPVEAGQWINRAVDNGFERAYRVLGWMHQTGTGVSESPTEAIKWGFRGVLSEIRQGDDANRKAMLAWEGSFETAYDEAVSSSSGSTETETDSSN